MDSFTLALAKDYIDSKIDGFMMGELSPEIIDKIAQKTKVARTEISDSVATLEPDKFYVFPEMQSLDITLGGESDSSIVQEYKFRFTSGETATSLILPDTIIGDVEVIANSVIEISIIDNFAVSQSWAVS